MPQYLVELYLSRFGSERVAAAAERAGGVAAAVDAQFLRAIFAQSEETCFFLFEARSAEAVRAVGAVLGLPFDHVVEVVSEVPA